MLPPLLSTTAHSRFRPSDWHTWSLPLPLCHLICHHIPHYENLLQFLDLQAQASKSVSPDSTKKPYRLDSQVPHAPKHQVSKSLTCVACKKEKHPVYSCSHFKSLGNEDRMSIVKSHGLCINCLHPGHQARDCRSSHHCCQCQRPHHTLLHTMTSEPTTNATNTSVSNHAATNPETHVLLMTCCVIMQSPDGTITESRALLDSGSSVSFISQQLAQQLAQQLHLPRSNQSSLISGIDGISSPSSHALTHFRVWSIHFPSKVFNISAVIVPKVTCDLPIHPLPSSLK